MAFEIHIHLPLACCKDVITIYTVHYIGFIPPSGGPCSGIVLLNVLTMQRGKFYAINCQPDSMSGNVASLAPLCLGSGSKNSFKLFCRVACMDDGILI